MVKSKTYTIGELAREIAVPVETIRYYERERLLPKPARSTGNYRLYTDDQRERLSFIKHCRSLDMALEEVRALLNFRDAPEKSCEEVNALLDAHIGHVADRIADLRKLRQQLQALRNQCDSVRESRDCAILKGLAALPAGDVKPTARGHVSRSHRG